MRDTWTETTLREPGVPLSVVFVRKVPIAGFPRTVNGRFPGQFWRTIHWVEHTCRPAVLVLYPCIVPVCSSARKPVLERGGLKGRTQLSSVYVRSWFRRLQIPRYSSHGIMTKSGSHEATLPVLANTLKTASINIRLATIIARRAKDTGHGRIDLMIVMLVPLALASVSRWFLGRSGVRSGIRQCAGSMGQQRRDPKQTATGGHGVS